MRAFYVLVVAAGLFACGGGGTDYTCCINKLYYQCTTDNGQNACGGGDTTACPRDATKDNTCN